MKKLHTLPHRVCESTCYVNGLEDLLAWKGADYTDFLLSMVGGMAGFAYLRFKRADPPCMVYWGANPKYSARVHNYLRVLCVSLLLWKRLRLRARKIINQ